MKKIIFPLCFLVLFSVSVLAVQENSTSQEEVAAENVRHYSAPDHTGFFTAGIDLSPMPIASQEDPVTVQEYCDFLNDMAPKDDAWLSSPYYEASFMNTDHDRWSFEEACIYRTGYRPYYHYTPILGHEHDIIDAITRDVNPFDNYIPAQFKEWRNRKRGVEENNSEEEIKIQEEVLYDTLTSIM